MSPASGLTLVGQVVVWLECVLAKLNTLDANDDHDSDSDDDNDHHSNDNDHPNSYNTHDDNEPALIPNCGETT